MDDPLCSTCLTGTRLQQILATSKTLPFSKGQLQHVKAEVIGDGQGFMSKILRVFLNWSPETKNCGLPETVIVKFMDYAAPVTYQQAEKAVAERAQRGLLQIHDIECSLYDLDELKSAVRIPRCYAGIKNSSAQPGMLILEDIGDRAVSMPAKLYGLGLNAAQLESVLDTLTSLHAWSLNTTIDWKSTIPPLKDVLLFQTLQDQLVSMLPSALMAYPEIFEGLNQELYLKYLNKGRYLEIFASDPKAKYNLPVVMVHGDIHFINMGFERRGEGYGNKLTALLDWQLVHAGCGMEDLARLVTLSLSVETRKQWKRRIVERYVELFNAKVQNPEERIKLEDAQKAYEEMLAYMGLMWVCWLERIDTFTRRMKGVGEQEQPQLQKRIFDHHVSNFMESRKYYGI